MGSLRYAGLFATLVERDKNQNGDNNDNNNDPSPGSQSVTALLGAVLGIALLFVCTMMYGPCYLVALRSNWLIQQQSRCLLQPAQSQRR
jgi:hypothetical protein